MSGTVLDQKQARPEAAPRGRFFDIEVRDVTLGMIARLEEVRLASETAAAERQDLSRQDMNLYRGYSEGLNGTEEAKAAAKKIARIDGDAGLYHDHAAIIRREGERAARELLIRIPLPGIVNVGERPYWSAPGKDGQPVLRTVGEKDSVVEFGDTLTELPDYSHLEVIGVTPAELSDLPRRAAVGDYAVLLSGLLAVQQGPQPQPQ